MNIEQKYLSVGFADLERFHKYVLKYGGKSAIELLNETYNLAGNIIIENEGKIIKYIGDEILFILNNPSKSKFVAEKIVNCFRKDFDEYTIRYNVSIATGEVFLTNIGHPSFIQYDIFGEVVNKAALMQKESGNNSHKYILCDETIKHIKEG